MSTNPPLDQTPEIYQDPISNDKKKRIPFFALVIGIDEYQTVDKLSGAVADADDVETFLRKHLGVPQSHIISLRDRTATRKRIIKAFRDLQRNPDIKRDDAIFIYFAGHGSEADAPAGWSTSESKIQVLLPQDVETTDASNKLIPPIPDRSLGALLDNLAYDKGNNITVVFDCCHSSSGTRGDLERRARVAQLKCTLPNDLDNAIIPEQKGRAMITPTAFLQRNLRSHVLLAACGSDELAFENTKLGRGAFTSAFVETLTNNDVDKLTYVGLMERLPNLPKQNPQCEGYHRNRVLFNAKIPGAQRCFIGVEKQGDGYRLKAGTAQGITANSEFTVHADRTLDSELNPSLCTMRAKEVGPFRATLEFFNDDVPVAFPNLAYARQTRSGTGQELRVHFTGALQNVVSLDEIRQASVDTSDPDFGFLTNEADNAEVIVDVKNTEQGTMAIFAVTESFAKQHGYERLPHEVQAKAETISHVLRAAARWNYHFKRTNPARFSRSVSLEFHRLEQVEDSYDESGLQIMKPVGENLNRTGFVDMVVNKTHYFGVKILNNSKVDLYPYLFYFDVSDQVIESYYLASTGRNKVDPPLKAGSSHTVGYGAGGEVPFAFHLRDGEEIDVGFLKLFITTSPTDFDSLQQISPFERARAPVPKEDVIQRLKDQSKEETDYWGTVMTAIVQRATPNPSEPSSDKPSEHPPNVPPEVVSPTPKKGWLSRISDHLGLGCFS